MKISIAGAGYVGLPNAMLIAQNHEAVVLDINPAKIEQLNNTVRYKKYEYKNLHNRPLACLTLGSRLC